MTKKSGWRVVRIGAVLAAASIALTGCIGGAAVAPTASTSGPAVSKDIPSDPIVLNMTGSTSPTNTALIEAFQALHPNVKINYESQQFNDYTKTIRLKMTSNNPPDIAAFQGPVNELIPGGYLLDLSPYEKLYGWDKTVASDVLNQWRLESDGITYGTGKLYGVPGRGLSVVGIWFNRAQLEKAGISEAPTTLAEFESALEKAKAAGLPGITLGALDTGAQQMFYVLLADMCPAKDLQNWVFGQKGATINTDCAKAAAQKFIDWTKAGYLRPELTGTATTDAAVAWAGGQGVFTFNGNWNKTAAVKGLGDNAGFTLLQEKGRTAAATGASGGYAASANTKYPDVVAAFLNFMSSKDAAQIHITGGLLPVDASSVPTGTKLDKEIATSYAKVTEDKGLVQFLEYAAPDVQDRLTSGIQSLMLDRTTAADFVKSLQDVWEARHK